MLVACSITSNFASACSVCSLGVLLGCVLLSVIALLISEFLRGSRKDFFFNRDFDREVLTEQGALITQMADYICRLFCSSSQGIFCSQPHFSAGRPNLSFIFLPAGCQRLRPALTTLLGFLLMLGLLHAARGG